MKTKLTLKIGNTQPLAHEMEHDAARIDRIIANVRKAAESGEALEGAPKLDLFVNGNPVLHLPAVAGTPDAIRAAFEDRSATDRLMKTIGLGKGTTTDEKKADATSEDKK